MDWKTQHSKDVNLPKFIYKFNALTIRIPERFSVDIGKIILKLYEKTKKP